MPRDRALRWACQRGLCEQVTTESRHLKAEKQLCVETGHGHQARQLSLFLLFQVSSSGLGAQVAVSKGPHVHSAAAWAGRPRKGPGWTTHLSRPPELPATSLLRQFPPSAVQLALLIMLYACTLLFAKDFTT